MHTGLSLGEVLTIFGIGIAIVLVAVPAIWRALNKWSSKERDRLKKEKGWLSESLGREKTDKQVAEGELARERQRSEELERRRKAQGEDHRKDLNQLTEQRQAGAAAEMQAREEAEAQLQELKEELDREREESQQFSDEAYENMLKEKEQLDADSRRHEVEINQRDEEIGQLNKKVGELLARPSIEDDAGFRWEHQSSSGIRLARRDFFV